MKILTLTAALACCLSCTPKRPVAKTPPPPANGLRIEYVDLLPQTELHILTAYFKEGAPRTGIEGYLGTASAEYRARPTGGLELTREESNVAAFPADQPPPRELIRPSQRRHRKYRFYYAVVFTQKGSASNSVLLGANSADDIERLGAQLLAEPDSICSGDSPHCTIFPKTTTVSVAMQIFVNGTPKTVQWRTNLASVTPGARHIEITRRSAVGRLTATVINMADPAAVRTFLLPGDQVKWE
jgi:hypothetical protein